MNNIATDNLPSQQTPTRPAMTGWQQAALSLYWFATSAHWSALLMTLLPMQAERIGGEAQKGSTLSNIVLVGALVSMVMAPVFGAWSDRVRTRWGRRKPFLVVGTLGNIIGLIALAYIPAIPSALMLYTMAFMWIQFFNNLATAPYSALIPDVVPEKQRGSASGWMGLMSMMGTLTGALTGLALGLIGAANAYFLLAGILLLGMLGTVLTVHEPEPAETAGTGVRDFFAGLAAPFRSRDFAWVFGTRFLIMLGVYTVQIYLQYYLKDVVAGGADRFAYALFGHTLASAAPAALSILLLALLAGAVGSSLVAGKLSDRHGRKRMVYLSGALQSLVVIVFLSTHRYDLVVLMGLIFGLGYGAYLAVDWALATDVLPNKKEYAKDMGIWHVAITLPQVTAAPIAGRLLDHYQAVGRTNGHPTLGYIVIFTLALAYFIIGTILVKQVRGTR